MKTTTTLISLILLCIFSSCNSSKNLQQLVYLNDSLNAAGKLIYKNYEPLIQPGDRLSIIVNALNPASVAPYNLSTTTPSATGAAVGTGSGGFLVKADGTIQFPQLGALQVAGKTIQQANDMLTARLTKYVTDPLVTITFLNFKITVLGDVNRPGPIPVADGKLNIIEAIGMAGDLTIYGRRDNILVLREKEGKREFGRLNLLSNNIFNSPYYQLQQNDVVYVEMTKAKAATSDQTTFRNISIATSIISVLSTLVIVIVNLTR